MTINFLKQPAYYFAALSLLSTFSGQLPAQKYSNEFLKIGVGAAGQGKGYGVASSMTGPQAAYWNPAGLVRSDHFSWELIAMHSEWFGGIGQYDYLGFSLPTRTEKQRLGMAIIRFGIDDIPNTLNLYNQDGTLNFDQLSTFSASDYAFLFTISRQLGQTESASPISWGLNAKVIHRRIGAFANAWGFGLDAGVQYHREPFQFGIMLRDISTTFNIWQYRFSESEKAILGLTGNTIPTDRTEITAPQVIFGFSTLKRFEKLTVSPEFNLFIYSDGRRNTLLSGNRLAADPALGVEIGFVSKVFLRGGANQFQWLSVPGDKRTISFRPAIGAGFKLNRFSLDYAFNDPGIGRGAYSHILSTQLKWGVGKNKNL